MEAKVNLIKLKLWINSFLFPSSLFYIQYKLFFALMESGEVDKKIYLDKIICKTTTPNKKYENIVIISSTFTA